MKYYAVDDAFEQQQQQEASRTRGGVYYQGKELANKATFFRVLPPWTDQGPCAGHYAFEVYKYYLQQPRRQVIVAPKTFDRFVSGYGARDVLARAVEQYIEPLRLPFADRRDWYPRKSVLINVLVLGSQALDQRGSASGIYTPVDRVCVLELSSATYEKLVKAMIQATPVGSPHAVTPSDAVTFKLVKRPGPTHAEYEVDAIGKTGMGEFVAERNPVTKGSSLTMEQILGGLTDLSSLVTRRDEDLARLAELAEYVRSAYGQPGGVLNPVASVAAPGSAPAGFQPPSMPPQGFQPPQGPQGFHPPQGFQGPPSLPPQGPLQGFQGPPSMPPQGPPQGPPTAKLSPPSGPPV